MIDKYLVHGWIHLFMVQVDYKLFGTSWCMFDALVYGTGYRLRYRLMHGSDLLVQVYSGISHSGRLTVVPSFYFYFRVVGWGKDRWLCHLLVVAGEHRGL
jgi:hypothetical protein